MARVEETIERMGRAAGFVQVESYATPTGLFVSLHDPQGKVYTRVKRIRGGQSNIALIAEVNSLSRAFSAGEITAQEVRRELERLQQAGTGDSLTRPLIGGGGALALALWWAGPGRRGWGGGWWGTWGRWWGAGRGAPCLCRDDGWNLAGGLGGGAGGHLGAACGVPSGGPLSQGAAGCGGLRGGRGGDPGPGTFSCPQQQRDHPGCGDGFGAGYGDHHGHPGSAQRRAGFGLKPQRRGAGDRGGHRRRGGGSAQPGGELKCWCRLAWAF